ncbi:hypothetical protein P2318_04595 [Myxococcaceae bacterium GXIMD 01537]
MGLWVGLLKFDTMYGQDVPLAKRKALLKAAVEKLQTKLVNDDDIGLAVFPEYFFAEPTVNRTKHQHGDVRSIDEEEKDEILTFVQEVSEACPKIIIIPGTIAWHKPFERQGVSQVHSHGTEIGTPKVATRHQKALVSVRTSQTRLTGVAYDPTRTLSGHELANNGYVMNPNWFLDPNAPTSVLNFNVTGWNLNKYVTKFSDQFSQREALITDFETTPRKKHRMVRNTAYAFQGGYCKFKYNKQGDFHEVLGGSNHFAYVPGTENGNFRLNDIDFGIEICLDHALGYLRAQNTNEVDIHIILSATVVLNPANIIARDKGFIVHSDCNPVNSVVKKYRAGPPRLKDIPNGNISQEQVIAAGLTKDLWCYLITPAASATGTVASVDTMLEDIRSLDDDTIDQWDWRACLTRINTINQTWARPFKQRIAAIQNNNYLAMSQALNEAVVANFPTGTQHSLSSLWSAVRAIHAIAVQVEPNKGYANVLKKVVDDHIPLKQNVVGGPGNVVSKHITSNIRGCRCVDCGATHDWTMSTLYSGNWHRCRTCDSIYCPPCGKRLASPSYTSRERTCRNCTGRTKLVS